ncbi:MAG: hypothetical protein MZV70_30950, partial [Desulfobacterales bacterium]|nr:hypothetical protein [Desulfobacterales bacterium]
SYVLLRLNRRLRRNRQHLPGLCRHPGDAGSVLSPYLIAQGYLTPDGEMVMLGETAEREFGRSNWKDLYSVISGGGEYRAVTPDGEVVGKLDARFVNSQNDGEISLGGQGWSMVKCDEGHNLVVVVPSESRNIGNLLDRRRERVLPARLPAGAGDAVHGESPCFRSQMLTKRHSARLSPAFRRVSGQPGCISASVRVRGALW